MEAIKQTIIDALVIAFGAPALDYVTIAATLATVGVVWMAIHLGGKTIMAINTTIVASLPGGDS